MNVVKPIFELPRIMGCPFTIIPYILSFALLIVLWASELFAFHIPCESKAMRASA